MLPAPTDPRLASNPVRAILPLVGGTPLLDLALRVDGAPLRVFAKYESLNFTGSIKDRMAAHILGVAYADGAIAPGDEIVEASSGNTAISFAAIGRALGHPVRIFMPDWMSAERKAILRAFGATLVEVSAAEGGFVGSVERAREWAASRPRSFAPRQFENSANVAAHALGTGKELLEQMAAVGCEPNAFVAGVGTGGTVMGVARAITAQRPSAKIHPVEPRESPILSLGRHSGHHRIQGISDEFVPAIVRLDELAAPIAVSDGDAIRMAQRLARELGLGVGISSGANLIAAIEAARALGSDAVVATVLPDSHKKYLSTDLFRDEPARPDHWTDRVRLEGYRAVPWPCPCRAELSCRALTGPPGN